MKIVVDANRVMSAILKDGSTRRALVETSSALFAPESLRAELARHRTMLRERSELDDADLASLIGVLTQRISWVALAAFPAEVATATQALAARDPGDVPYLAAALAIGAEAIWGEDTDFDAQTLVPRTRHPDRIER